MQQIEANLSSKQSKNGLCTIVLFHTLIYTGARKGELSTLTWDDIDFNSGSIRLAKTLFQHDGKHIFQTPKTRDSRSLINSDGKAPLSLLKKLRIRPRIRKIFLSSNGRMGLL